MLRQLLISLLIALSASSTMADQVATEILVKYKDGNSFSTSAGRHIGHGVHLIAVPQTRANNRSESLASQLAAMRANPRVEYAEPNYHGHFTDAPSAVAVPNDPGYNSQWWLDAVGARQSWAVATGQGISVAVIDSGVDLTHPDLVRSLRSDGYNFGDGNATPQDALGHGTFVAGIVAAQRNNGLAGSGLAPDARILPIKINPGKKNDFSTEAVQQAIDYAVEKRAQVINFSFAFTPGDAPQTVKDALQRAFQAGIVVIAASGNESQAVSFPANYPGVIAVAGSNQDGSLASFSNLGPEVILAAPATGMQSTLLGGGFGINGQGTSYAAPVVAATIALLLQTDLRLQRPQLVSLLRTNGRALTTSGMNFNILDSGKSLLALLPDLHSTQNTFAQSDSLRLDYRLPATAAASDLYVALHTPVGEFSLLADGSWSSVASNGYSPLIQGFSSSQTLSGHLYGDGAPFPAIALAGLPAGNYSWRIALFDPRNQRLIGPVISAPITLQ
jgi:subtilisin family serine protease